jgi:hypothetical protein
MKFEDAVEKSIKSFLKGRAPEELMKVQDEPVIYTLDYMDELEEDLADMEPLDEEEVDDV